MENFGFCSFAHHACSPFMQGFLHEEELCRMVTTCHLLLVGCVTFLSRLSGSLFLEWSLWHSLQVFLFDSADLSGAIAVCGCEFWRFLICGQFCTFFAAFCILKRMKPDLFDRTARNRRGSPRERRGITARV